MIRSRLARQGSLVLYATAALLLVPLLLAMSGAGSVDPPPAAGLTAAGALKNTMRAERPDLAPPATRPGLIRATLPFMDEVPMLRTGNFDWAQLMLGRRSYAQYCTTCHGVQGQGLEASRHTWPEEKQNCTQSGCHGRNHPPDGFQMLKVAPPLIGSDALHMFANAFALYHFTRASMPYQAPGTLSDEEYWAITAYLADQRGGNTGESLRRAKLDADNAAQVTLH